MLMTYEELARIIFTLSKEEQKQCVTVKTDNDEYFPVQVFTKTDTDGVLDSQHWYLPLTHSVIRLIEL